MSVYLQNHLLDGASVGQKGKEQVWRGQTMVVFACCNQLVLRTHLCADYPARLNTTCIRKASGFEFLRTYADKRSCVYSSNVT
ncbi:hypothetical protein BIW11_02565 [Tropilaelaps mercedesae]|uniref:Uncharacterized protein n=1 Tax=Tropilaelaps mercedesae TaxID=418985 RepID=A0A1V9Y1A0_9ACAR|nr:hypothetical protein BIW11_02565 [Tropilaelaps mercedesae]